MEGGRKRVGEGLRMFGQVVRFLDRKTEEETSFIAEDLVREAWPSLGHAAEVGRRALREGGGVGGREGRGKGDF